MQMEVDRQQYEKGRSGKDRNLTDLSQVPTASCDFMGINWQKYVNYIGYTDTALQ